MADRFIVVEQSSGGSAISASDTFDITYPTGYGSGHFVNGEDHKIVVKNGPTYTANNDFTLAFGAGKATATWKSSADIPANSTLFVQLDMAGPTRSGDVMADLEEVGVVEIPLVAINLGSPDVADPNGICESQAGTAATEMTLDGALVSGGVATFDVPRNVVGGWTNTATLTVTGTDRYGRTQVETSGSGTSMAGKKAFKTITSVVPSANITGATVGTGDVLGLPIFITDDEMIRLELEDGAEPTNGTIVAGVTVEPTATSGDPFGTYDPNSACDGDKGFTLIAFCTDPAYRPPTYGG